MVHDVEPEQIDHVNGDRLDNRICNLRAATNHENLKNRSLLRTNKSGVTGVYRESCTNRWRASIDNHGKTIRLGRYHCIAHAARVRKEAERKYGFHENHGRKRNACLP